MKKLPSTTRDKLPGVAGVAVLLVVWQLVCMSALVPSYMLPSPVQVVTAFVKDAPALGENLLITLQEAALGLCIGEEIVVSQPRPRHVDFNLTPEFLGYKRRIMAALHAKG